MYRCNTLSGLPRPCRVEETNSIYCVPFTRSTLEASMLLKAKRVRTISWLFVLWKDYTERANELMPL